MEIVFVCIKLSYFREYLVSMILFRKQVQYVLKDKNYRNERIRLTPNSTTKNRIRINKIFNLCLSLQQKRKNDLLMIQQLIYLIEQMMDHLIKQQSYSLDYQIIRQLPSLHFYFDHDLSISYLLSQPSNQQIDSEYSDLIPEYSHGQSVQTEILNTKENKDKTIKQRLEENQSQDFSEFLIIKMKPSERRKRGTKPKGYPTKNFLQNFKSPHFDFLEGFLGKDYVMSFQEVKHIKEKKGINLKDYEILYKVPEFQNAFEQFFASKVLYRWLLTSRSIQGVKKIHQRKLYVFEKAFLSKRFEKIN